MKNKKEIWKNIIGYEHYLISNLGRVFAVERVTKNNKFLKGKFLSTKNKSKGYYSVSLTNLEDSKQFTFKIHRLLAIHFIPKVEGKNQVNHINGIKTDNRLENLEWCTNQENVKHAFDIGLRVIPSGDKNLSTKIFKQDYEKIKEMYTTGKYSKTALAAKFGVHRRTILRILNK